MAAPGRLRGGGSGPGQARRTLWRSWRPGGGGRAREPRHGYAGPIARGGKLLGQVEEYFVESLAPGDTFVFSGEILRYEGLVGDEIYVSRASGQDPKIPSYEGGKFPLSTY